MEATLRMFFNYWLISVCCCYILYINNHLSPPHWKKQKRPQHEIQFQSWGSQKRFKAIDRANCVSFFGFYRSSRGWLQDKYWLNNYEKKVEIVKANDSIKVGYRTQDMRTLAIVLSWWIWEPSQSYSVGGYENPLNRSCQLITRKARQQTIAGKLCREY
jgi:hypothetical protein